jgi:hypothetical protein
MAKIKISWTETVVETYHAVVEYDEFAAMVKKDGGEVPTPGEIEARTDEVINLLGESYGGWDSAVAAMNDRDPDSSSVECREVDDIVIVEA